MKWIQFVYSIDFVQYLISSFWLYFLFLMFALHPNRTNETKATRAELNFQISNTQLNDYYGWCVWHSKWIVYSISILLDTNNNNFCGLLLLLLFRYCFIFSEVGKIVGWIVYCFWFLAYDSMSCVVVKFQKLFPLKL